MEKVMISYVKLADILEAEGTKSGYTLLDDRHGCVNGSRCGISMYRNEEYGKAGQHDDQEGFFVLEGSGKAIVGDEEIDMEPGVAFMVPAHVEHAMKKDKGCEVCKVFWFHASV
jgi:quercetin dioxygenase-like cupin family protein